jgi:hypothetical protein
MRKHRPWGAGPALVALAIGAAGCAAIEPEGEAAGIYFSGQRAESLVQDNLPVVAARTLAVLADMGVTRVSGDPEPNDLDLEIRGSGPGGQAVHVKLEEDADGNTRVRAWVRRNSEEWDRHYARAIVERIVDGS